MKKKPNTLTNDNCEYVEQVHDNTFNDVDRYCSHLTDNTADAEDLRQETYTRFSTRVSNKGPLTQEGIEKPYLFNTAKNTLRNQRRDNRIRVTSLQNDADEGADDQDKKVGQLAGKTEYVEYTAAVRRSTYFDGFRTLIPIIESKLTP
jgi:DNA-directed RNA polymerase specialized sigma24 family protein